MNVFNKWIIFIIILFLIYNQNLFNMDNLAKTVLGRALLVFSIIYISTNYGAILGILTGIVVILMLHDRKEGATGSYDADDVKKDATTWPDEVPVKLLIPTKMSKTDLENALNRSKEEATAEASGQFTKESTTAAAETEGTVDVGSGGGTGDLINAVKSAIEEEKKVEETKEDTSTDFKIEDPTT